MSGTVLAVDIGGTKTAAAVVDEQGRVLRRAQVPTPATGTDEEAFAAVLAAVERVAPDGVLAVGVGVAGPMTPEGAISPVNIPAWRRFPLGARLAEALGRPVAVDNDAKAFALGEGWRGAARGVPHHLSMVVSTGIGGGVVLDGRLLDGHARNAGHIGHVVVVPGGEPCGCGSRGCVEAHVSGSGFQRRHGRGAETASPEEVAEAGALLGRALAAAVVLLDLPLVVVGGSVGLGWGAPFLAAAERSLHDVARVGFAGPARVVPAGLGPDAPLVGAAAVAWRDLLGRLPA